MGEVVNLVMGVFGIASDVLHYLVQKVQESRAVAVGLRSYKVESEVENGDFWYSDLKIIKHQLCHSASSMPSVL